MVDIHCSSCTERHALSLAHLCAWDALIASYVCPATKAQLISPNQYILYTLITCKLTACM